MPQDINRSGDMSIWEVPEIDGVCRSLERGTHDDEASDRWFRLIDYATDPRPMNEDRREKIQNIVKWFVERDAYMQAKLEIGSVMYDTPDLAALYQSTLNQIAEIAGAHLQAPAGL